MARRASGTVAIVVVALLAGFLAGRLRPNPTPAIAAEAPGDPPSGKGSLAKEDSAKNAPSTLLTKHENQTFQNQTVYLNGQAFIKCNFVGCTMVMRDSIYHLEGCEFERCNWHLDYMLLWGSPDSLREVKALIKLLEEAQRQQGQKPSK